MGNKNVTVASGNINAQKIYATHTKIKKIVEEYVAIQHEVADIERTIEENWVGEGRNEFETQYNMLISKVDDFGDVLAEMYDNLVQAEADYETADNDLKINYDMAMQ